MRAQTYQDPRSPTKGLSRTPLQMPASENLQEKVFGKKKLFKSEKVPLMDSNVQS